VTAFVHILEYVITVYTWLIVARALFSWFPLRRGTSLMRLYDVIYDLTEPYLALFRRIIPTSRGRSVAIDWSALAGLLVLFILLQVISRL
jgi:uncharacterized protein YggT (Ycf19 family)